MLQEAATQCAKTDNVLIYRDYWGLDIPPDTKSSICTTEKYAVRLASRGDEWLAGQTKGLLDKCQDQAGEDTEMFVLCLRQNLTQKADELSSPCAELGREQLWEETACRNLVGFIFIRNFEDQMSVNQPQAPGAQLSVTNAWRIEEAVRACEKTDNRLVYGEYWGDLEGVDDKQNICIAERFADLVASEGDEWLDQKAIPLIEFCKKDSKKNRYPYYECLQKNLETVSQSIVSPCVEMGKKQFWDTSMCRQLVSHIFMSKFQKILDTRTPLWKKAYALLQKIHGNGIVRSIFNPVNAIILFILFTLDLVYILSPGRWLIVSRIGFVVGPILLAASYFRGPAGLALSGLVIIPLVVFMVGSHIMLLVASKRRNRHFLIVVLILMFPALARAGTLPVDRIRLPEGFKIDVYAQGVENARSLELTPGGTLFVGSRTAGKVYALVDEDHDFRADRVYMIAEGLNMPNGVAFRDGDLYVAEIHRVVKFEGIEECLSDPPPPVVVSDDYPNKSWHGWKFIRFGPDGKLYVPVGAPCNVCERDDPYAAMTRIDKDGTGLEVVARGIRNTVGFDWHPVTDELWFTDNGRDMLGDDLPPDELNRISGENTHFGFPYCHGRDIADPEFGRKRACAEFTAPAQELDPHVAALGMRFYTGTMFPDEYIHNILVAEHGSWNRSRKIGYRVMLVALDNNEATDYRLFAEGWKQGEKVWGRPVDIEQMPDGSILVSDDHADAVYRISYENP